MFASLVSIKLLIILQCSLSAPLMLAPSSSVSLLISAQGSSIGSTSWDCTFEELLHPTDITSSEFLCPTDVTTSNYGTAKLEFKLILHMHGPGSTVPAVMPIVMGKFITVNLLVLKEGINYSSKVFGSHFLAAWAVILDMHAMLRNLIYTNTGTGKSHDIFSLHATEFLSKLEVVSGGLGQPIEKDTFSSHVILSLILAHRNGVQPDWVHRIHVTCRTKNPEFGTSCTIPCEFHSMSDKYPQMMQERYSYQHSMMAHTIVLACNPKKSDKGGFDINVKKLMPEELQT